MLVNCARIGYTSDMKMTIHGAVKDLRRALSLSQQAFATQLGLSIRAVVNYEKDRVPTARALAQLERLAAANDQVVLARIFGDALASQLRLSRSERPPLSAEELYLELAFQRCVFENPRSPVAVQIRKQLQPFVEQLRKEDESSVRILDKQEKIR